MTGPRPDVVPGAQTPAILYRLNLWFNTATLRARPDKPLQPMHTNSDPRRNWRRRIFTAATFAACEIFFSPAAFSQADNWVWCAGQDNPTFDQRVAACTAILESEGVTPSDRAKALGNRGVAYDNAGKHAGAIQDYEESVRLDPMSGSSHRFRGNQYKIRGNIQDALAEYDEAIRLDATDAFAFSNRGSIYFGKKDYDRAFADFSEAIRLVPTWAPAFYGRGMASSTKKDYDRAIADFGEAIQLNPGFIRAFIARGAAYRLKGDSAQAIADYDRAIQLDPKSNNAFYHRGVARYFMKDYDAAIADFNEAIRLNSRFAIAFTGRGLAHRAKGNVAQAISDYDQAIQLDPKSVNAFHNRGTALAAQRQYDRAISDFSTAIQLDPKYAVAFVSRGFAYREKGDVSQALANYDLAIQADPKLAVAYANRCGDRISAGQDAKTALTDCNESLRLQPGMVLALNNRGYAHLKLGLVAQAIADFEAALSNDPKNAWSLYGRGLAKWKKGDTSDSEADIKAANKTRSDIARAVAKYYGVGAERGLASRMAVAYSEEHAMIFAIAHGAADACGPGCNEWIVAEGAFDKGIEKRLRSFLGTLKGRKLPIFFNSTGGSMNQSYMVGRILRERGMRASVGATLPDDCQPGKTMDEACRKIVQTSTTLKAQLRTNGAYCHSACVYALMGAPDRQIPADALVGVHAPVGPPPKVPQSARVSAEHEARLHAARRQYAIKMGVDPDLVELADKTPYAGLHILTRDEIARFRMETPRK